MKHSIKALVGPTGSGKTSLSLQLFDKLKAKGVEPILLNTDLQQLYVGLDIGVAKLTKNLLEQYPHKLVDIMTEDKKLKSEEVANLLKEQTDIALENGQTPIWVGGSITLLWYFLDDSYLKKATKKKNPNDYIFEIYTPYFKDRPFLYKNIEDNVDEMFTLGLYEEFKSQRNNYREIMHSTIGYKEFFEYCALYRKNPSKLNKADLGKIAWRIKKNSKKLALNQINALKKLKVVKRVSSIKEITV